MKGTGFEKENMGNNQKLVRIGRIGNGEPKEGEGKDRIEKGYGYERLGQGMELSGMDGRKWMDE